MGAASVLCFPHVYSSLRELALLHGFCLDSQTLGTDGQDHNEDAHHKCHQGPEEAMQEDNLIMCAMQEHVVWSAWQWEKGKKVWSADLAWHWKPFTTWSPAFWLKENKHHWKRRAGGSKMAAEQVEASPPPSATPGLQLNYTAINLNNQLKGS